MKKAKNYLSLLIALLVVSSFGACTKNDDTYNEVTLTLNATPIEYDFKQGLLEIKDVWSKVFDNDAQLVSQGISFTHTADIKYFSWNGFVPSRSSDTADYSSKNWMEQQWSAMTGGGMSGKGTPYIVSYWNSMDTDDLAIDKKSCVIKYGEGKTTFTAQSMYVTNQSWAYYAIKNGSAYSKKFAQGDYFILNIYGYKDGGTVVGPIKVYLADYRSEKESEWKLITDWQFVNLAELGTVNSIYFQMESSDTGTWGMNTPGYFCMDRLKIKL